MAVTAYLFLFTISFASGTYFSDYENESPSESIRPKLSYHRRYQSPYHKYDFSEFLLEDCLRRIPYSQLYKCHQYFESYKEGSKNNRLSNNFNENARNLMQGILNENNNQVDKPESYINSVLDEDKRDASNLNASDKVLNSTWIEIKDPRKAATTLKNEIANVEETGEFVSFPTKHIAGKESNSLIVQQKGNEIIGNATDSTNTIGEKTTGLKEQTVTVTITNDAVAITTTSIDKDTIITRETTDVSFTEEITGGQTTTEKDFINTASIGEENEGNTKKTTGVSSLETVEKSTTADLPTDNSINGFKVTTTKDHQTYTEVTTDKGPEDRTSSIEQNLSTESSSTSIEPKILNNDTTLSMLLTDNTNSESFSVSDADISSSSQTESITTSSNAIFPSISVTESSGYTTESNDAGFTSTMVTDSETSSGDHVTISVITDHVINIRSIKIAKIVLSVLLLVTGLIAVVMLAIYVFRVRRGAVQYDQLTLLP